LDNIAITARTVLETAGGSIAHARAGEIAGRQA